MNEEQSMLALNITNKLARLFYNVIITLWISNNKIAIL
jgi:hypothetical protein